MKIANSVVTLKTLVLAARVLGRLSSRLAGVPTYLLWFIPWRLPVSERGLQKQAGWLEATQPFVLKTSVGRVAGFTAGESGPFVVLVHGLGERGGSLGAYIAPLTEAGFRVVGIDLPGHGDSSRQMTNPIVAAGALREVADHFGGAHALIGHSLGGTAVLWAMKHGLVVQRTVLIAPSVDMRYAKDGFKAMFGLPSKAMTGLERKIERRYGRNIWHDLSGEHLAAHTNATGLVFHDPDDPQVPFEGSERLVRAWPGSRLIEAPGLGHGAITRDSSVIEGAVAFVKEPAPESRVSQPA